MPGCRRPLFGLPIRSVVSAWSGTKQQGHMICRTDHIADARRSITVVTSSFSSGTAGPLAICVPDGWMKPALLDEFNRKWIGQAMVFSSQTESHFMTQETFLVYLHQLVTPALSRQRAHLGVPKTTKALLLADAWTGFHSHKSGMERAREGWSEQAHCLLPAKQERQGLLSRCFVWLILPDEVCILDVLSPKSSQFGALYPRPAASVPTGSRWINFTMCFVAWWMGLMLRQSAARRTSVRGRVPCSIKCMVVCRACWSYGLHMAYISIYTCIHAYTCKHTNIFFTLYIYASLSLSLSLSLSPALCYIRI